MLLDRPGDAWVGGAYTGGSWRWLDGSPWVDELWDVDEPNFLGSEHCVHLRGNGRLNNHGCGSTFGMLCSRECSINCAGAAASHCSNAGTCDASGGSSVQDPPCSCDGGHGGLHCEVRVLVGILLERSVA